jgi:hypothetical protein
LFFVGAQALEAQSTAFRDIPLIVQEALPGEVGREEFVLLQGRSRTEAPVTFGVPLPDSAGIREANELHVEGSATAQFRVLARWPSGNVKWVLIDTQADVRAGRQNRSLRLTRAEQRRRGPETELARDDGNTIVVRTGSAEFEVRKTNFNLLDRVSVGNVELVSANASLGAVLIGRDGTTYLAARDPDVTVSIEENGPARAVVVAKGTHTSRDGGRDMDFTTRLHFYKGKSWVRAVYTLRNASRRQVENVGFRALELSLKTTLSSPDVILTAGTADGDPVEIRTSSSSSSSPDSGSDSRSLTSFLGDNDFPNVRDYDFDENAWPTTIAGHRVTYGDEVLAESAAESVVDLFYLGARKERAGAVTIGTRFAAGYWPQGLAIDSDGTVRVGLFPDGNDKLYYARFNGHQTREVLFDFSGDDPADSLFRFQYPVVGKAGDVEVYNRSGAMWETLVSFSDEARFYQSNGWPARDEDYATLDRRPDFVIFRHKYWGEGGGLNQYDFAKVDILNFLREEETYGGGYYLNAEQRFSYNADLALLHTDDYHAARIDEMRELDGEYGPVSFDEMPGAEHLATATAVFEGEHRHAYGLSDWYYLSGDERIREAYLDWGEFMQNQSVWHEWERGLIWNIYNWVDLYRFTGDAVYRELAWKALEQEIVDKTASRLESSGTDWNRGFFVDAVGVEDEQRSMAAFIKGAMFPRSYAYFLDYGAATEYQADRARDVLEGIARFVSDELWFEYSDEPGDFGFLYRVSADEAPPLDAREEEEWWGGLVEAYLSFYYGYLLTGEDEFLRKGRLLLKSTAYNPTSDYWFQDLPDRHALQRLLDRKNEYAGWRELPLEAERLADGSYQISWNVPEGAVQYWLKASERTIVPSLGFDRQTRTYRYDPETHTPFFAATNLEGEPTPGESSPGTLQTFTPKGLDRGRTYSFSGRYLRRAPKP